MKQALTRSPHPDPATEAFLRLLPNLHAWVRLPEVAWLRSRGIDMRRDPPPLGELELACEEAIGLRRRITDRRETLRGTALGLTGQSLREVLGRHLRATERDADRLREDLLALDRDLDLTCLLEREDAILEEASARLEVGLLLIRALIRQATHDDLRRVFADTRIMALLMDRSKKEIWEPARRAAVSTLVELVAQSHATSIGLEPTPLRLLQRLTTDTSQSAWVRRKAGRVLQVLPPGVAARQAEQVFAVADPDAFCVRACVVEVLVERPHDFEDLMVAAASDPSQLVRLTLVRGLCAHAPGHPLLGALLRGEDPKVRAQVVASLPSATVGEFLAEALSDEAKLVKDFALDRTMGLDALPPSIRPVLEAMLDSPDAQLGRRAALALQRDQVPVDASKLAARLALLHKGEVLQVPLPEGVDVGTLAQALTLHAEQGHGFVLRPRRGHVTVLRGDRTRFRIWRLLDEARRPGPTKRQGHLHTVGRANTPWPIRVPPANLCEASSTGVVGQRQINDQIGGWAPAVPMVDDYLDAIDLREVTLVTAEGITTIRRPKNPLKQLLARAMLVTTFSSFEQRRTVSLANEGAEYLKALDKLGFTTTFVGQRTRGTRTLPVILDPLTYLVTLGANSLLHMALVLLVLVGLLIGRVAREKSRIRQARHQIPLSIGGWGTRGKSGTERIKAALFQGLGVPFLSKTTGCEAMFLHGPPMGRAIELFLFRPFDKATIWEQVDVVSLGPGLGARVFLWECMGLNPAYVDILSAGWMRDDLSTLTNAYPDHEDVQGPTGIDVARTIGTFAPPGGHVLTTEDNMRPVLADRARERGAAFEAITNEERFLLADDLVARMPYAEHPNNIALVVRIAQALDVDAVDAVGLMADHVVPDLGALIIYPTVWHMGRNVTFINGMSANDTLSWRNNWQRIGFQDHDHHQDPATYLVTVINNRADRVPRSRVFARIVTYFANAHRHVLIGTNLSGFVGYLDEALDEYLAGVTLDGTVERIDALFAHLRISNPEGLGKALAERLNAPSEDIVAWTRAAANLQPNPGLSWGQCREAAQSLAEAAEALAKATGQPELKDMLVFEVARWIALVSAQAHPTDPGALDLYRALVHAGVVLVDNPSASGDQIIAHTLQAVPPGAEIRMLGMQNIKGTGLDFAYQWVYWRELHTNIAELEDPEKRELALGAVEQNPFGSVFACDEALKVLAPLKDDAVHGVRVAGMMRVIDAKRQALLTQRGQTAVVRGWRARILAVVEALADPIDAILRRRRAQQVLGDLVNRRISHPAAQAELQRLTKRQKGGWLSK